MDSSQGGVIVPAFEAEPEFPLGIEEKDEVFLAGAEYFIETDPGEGNGTILDPEDLEFDQTDEGIASLNLTVYDFPPGNRRVVSGLRMQMIHGVVSDMWMWRLWMREIIPRRCTGDTFKNY